MPSMSGIDNRHSSAMNGAISGAAAAKTAESNLVFNFYVLTLLFENGLKIMYKIETVQSQRVGDIGNSSNMHIPGTYYFPI